MHMDVFLGIKRTKNEYTSQDNSANNEPIQKK